MAESTNTLLYTATYVIIFIIAVSLAIVLFLSVNRFADSAFEYSEGIETSIINTPTTGLEEAQKGQAHLTSTDVFSYFVNYIKKDLYGKEKSDDGKKDLYDEKKSDDGYNVTITTESGNLDGNMSYAEALKKIGTKNYILRYKGNKNIEITLN